MLIHNALITGSLSVNGTGYNTGSFSGSFSGVVEGAAATASYVEYNNIANKPALISGSSQISAFGYATTGSNQFNGNQAITGSLTTTGQIVAQTLNVQQVTSSIVYSSGSNIFGNSISNVQQFTGSISASGSMSITPGITVTGDGSNDMFKAVRAGNTRLVVKNAVNTVGINTDTINNPLTVNGGADFNGSVGIGYTSPSYRLSVSGSSNSGIFLKQGSQIGDSPSGSNFYSALTFENTSTTNAWSIGYSQGAKFSINYFDAASAYTRVLTATAAGDVGIGIVSPSQLLEAARSANADTVIQVSNSNIGTSATAQFFASNGSTRTQLYHTGTNYTTSGVLEANQGGIYNTTSAGIVLVAAGASGILRFATGGTTERMRITSGGDVGIGTTSPSSRLHIAGTFRNALASGAGGQTLISAITGVSNGYIINVDTSNNITHTWNTGANNPSLFISSGGNVGIGTTSPTPYTGGNVVLHINTSSTVSDIKLTNATSGTGATQGGLLRQDGNAMYLWNGSNGLLAFGTNNTERVRITSGGFVGIRQTSPLAPLHVASESGDNDANVQRWDYGGNSGYQLILKQTVTSGVVRWNFSQINNSTTYNDVLVLDRGNVGIGTTSPSYPLHVVASRILVSDSSNAGLMLRVNGADEYSIASTGGAFQIYDEGAGTNRLYINSSGNVGIGTTSPNALLSLGTSVSDNKLYLYDGTSDKYGFGIRSSQFMIYSGAQGSALGGITFGKFDGTTFTENVRFTNGGNVGIGTTAPAAKLSVCSTTACSTVVDVQGCAGQLFSITDNLVGEIFAVSDISGIPILGVNSNGTVSVDSKIAVGANHTVSGAYASVTGGRCNTASGACSTIGGGMCHVASGCFSTIGGGGVVSSPFIYGNTASGNSSTVAGGGSNVASASFTFVGGGRQNTASNYYASIGGGCGNCAQDYASFIGGGTFNITGTNNGRAFIGGGNANTSCKYGTVIGGGGFNTASNYYSSVLGGQSNTASGYYSTIGGGQSNTASGFCSTVGGGSGNTASAGNTTVGGGRGNIACQCNSTVSGGYFNCATGCRASSITGGASNTASGGYSAVLGGCGNIASFTWSSATNCNQQTSANNQFRVNTLSKGSGTFRIDHPDPSKKPTHYLSHSFVESPTAGDNIYRYKVNVVNGTAVINLPSYYKYLNENDQIWVTPQGHFGVGYGTVNVEQTQLTIYGNTDGEYNVLLIGTRKDFDAIYNWQGVETYK